MSEHTEIEIVDERIETTLGDLICAIHDVVDETTGNNSDAKQVVALTQLVLDSLRRHHEV